MQYDRKVGHGLERPSVGTTETFFSMCLNVDSLDGGHACKLRVASRLCKVVNLCDRLFLLFAPLSPVLTSSPPARSSVHLSLEHT